MGLIALVACGCSAVPEPKTVAEACAVYCLEERQDCYGALARIFRECTARTPNSQLDAQRCFQRRSVEALGQMGDQLEVPHPGPPAAGCEKRFEQCQQDCA
ncbi:MAG: hypothetical protein QNJ40_02075 [Xanthomonadales bacterium]|nr:hypothetical protein [Xanthomonadales bacterium]